MLTTSFRNTVLASLGGFVGLIKVITDFRAGTVTEAAYTGYGTRPAIAYGATAATSPVGGRQVANSGAVTFPQNTGGSEDQIAWGIWSLATGGVLQAIGFLDTNTPVLGTGAATGDLVTAVGHGFIADERVFVLACPGAVIPTGLAENTAYFVLASGLVTDAFKLSATSGGSAIDITANGAAFFMPYRAVTVPTNGTPSFAIGTLIAQI